MISYREVKVCLLGDSGVGKSSIAQRFVYNTFNPGAESTIGASFMMKTVTIKGETFKFNIWDTAGQERYRALAPMYYRGAGAAIIVYDITSQDSFEAVKSWVRELHNHGPPNIILGLAGNKCDREATREVIRADAESYADQINAVHIETSALRATNIEELFDSIAKRVPKLPMPKHVEHNLSLKPTTIKTKKCC